MIPTSITSSPHKQFSTENAKKRKTKGPFKGELHNHQQNTLRPELKVVTMSREHIRPPLLSFDEIDYEDPVALRSAQESMLREQWIRSNEFKYCRHALEKCFRHHGVNHYEECRDLAEKYLKMMPTHKVKGYTGYQFNDPSK